MAEALARELLRGLAAGLTRLGLVIAAVAVISGLALCALSSLPARPR